MNDVVQATDRKCCECVKPAVCFWPVIDPDISSHPYCRKCVDGAKGRLLTRLYEEGLLGEK